MHYQNLNKQLKEAKLAADLYEWIQTVDLNKKNFWNRNQVGKAIKQILGKYFRNRPRGNPKAGYIARKKSLGDKSPGDKLAKHLNKISPILDRPEDFEL